MPTEKTAPPERDVRGVNAFSWKKAIDRAEKHALQRQVRLAICNSDFKLMHEAETRDIAKGDFTAMKTRIHKEFLHRAEVRAIRLKKNTDAKYGRI